MSDSREHRNLKNHIRAALGGMQGVVCWNNESGQGFVGGIGTKCLSCGGPRRRTAIKYGVGDGGSDLLALVAPHGKLLAIEVKTGNATLQPNQRRFRALVESMGGRYVTARSVDDAVKAVKEIQDEFKWDN